MDDFAITNTIDVAAATSFAGPVISDPAPSLALRNLSIRFGTQPLLTIDDELIAGGQNTCLLGASGVGKSTLLKAIAGLINTDAGTITASDEQALCGRLTYMPQTDCLMPWLSLENNILIGRRLRGEAVSATDRERVQQLLADTGMASIAQRLPAQVSGGERQRAALARVLFENRPIILMDEPFSALDAITRHELQQLATELLQDRTIIMVTHDPLEAIRMANSIRVLAGKPATLSQPIVLGGKPPRTLDSAALWQEHSRLVAQLSSMGAR